MWNFLTKSDATEKITGAVISDQTFLVMFLVNTSVVLSVLLLLVKIPLKQYYVVTKSLQHPFWFY